MSSDLQKFLNDYFTGHPMIRLRGEEDITIWNKLKGEELEFAKQKILDELPSDQEYLMRAVSIFRDNRAIPKLEWTAENGKNEHTRCFASKILFDWIGYDQYFQKLDEVFKSNSQWSKTSLEYWIRGLEEDKAHRYFWLAMNDVDSFVRFSAYSALENYYGIYSFRTNGSEIKYFTDEDVYQNKPLFQSRQAELKEKIKQWKKKTVWTENKILLEYTQYTACKDIFKAVCDEIGKHYSEKGFKYLRSQPKIIFENEKLKLEIRFSSSGSNTPGQSVNLEILPSLYSKQIEDSNIKGYLFGHTGFFYHKYKEDVKKIRVNKIFGEVIERIDEYSNESNIIDSNNCNVYGLQKENFEKILSFIDTKIITWFDKLQTQNGVLELLENASVSRIWSLNGQGSKSDFVAFVKYHYPKIEIDKILVK
jgi:hypothetical protein